MRRSKAEAEKTRQRILASALVLFDEQGYAQTSLSEIARHAGVTRGAVYGHFANKEALLGALADAQFAEVISQNAAAIADADTWAKLTANLVQYFRHFSSSADKLRFSRIIHYQGHGEEALQRLKKRFEEQWQSQCRAAVARGKDNGDLAADADPQYLFFYLSALICGLIEHFLDNPQHPDYADYAARAIRDTFMLLRQPERHDN